MSVTSADQARPGRRAFHVPGWLWAGLAVCAILLVRGSALLRDPDTFWQIKVGQWILGHHAFPHADIYSFTMVGKPWMSSSWLSQVIFAQAYVLGGWSAVVLISSLAVAAALGLMMRALQRDLPPVYSGFIVVVAFALTSDHLFARPHVLVMPILVAWFVALIRASDARGAPPAWLLILMVLWANLHGSFVLGLGLAGLVAIDAIWNATGSQRASAFFKWTLFGLGAAAAACVTPYGWQTYAAAGKILDLGQALELIGEWQPVGFSAFDPFHAVLLVMVAAIAWFRITLPLPRILMVACLLQMALSHTRNVDTFVLLIPILMAAALARQFGGARVLPPQPARSGGVIALVSCIALGVAAAVSQSLTYRPHPDITPEAAVAVLKDRHARRVFNEYRFGGYMIWSGLAPYIDGRAELYGEAFLIDYFDAITDKDPDKLPALLARNRIDAALLSPAAPAVGRMDRMAGWRRVFADPSAVVFVRDAAGAGPPAN